MKTIMMRLLVFNELGIDVTYSAILVDSDGGVETRHTFQLDSNIAVLFSTFMPAIKNIINGNPTKVFNHH